MSQLISYMVTQGVPKETIILILMLPIVATIIAFARQVIGIKGFGIYTSLIIAFVFLSTGLKYGLAIFAVVLVTGTLMRFIIRRLRLLYLPRMAIVLTLVALVIIIMFLGATFFEKTGFLKVSIFPVLIVIILVEKFIAAQIEKGNRTAVILSLETVTLSILCCLIAGWPWLKDLVYFYPEWIFLTIVINIFLGKWTGLRLSEYFRFREVIKHR